ncbi:MAG: VapE domain-containing protein [Flavobacterium sp.]|uniref:VapE domain-containing protein n=1 Tax=Flavobacterium sp. TaxID=239 RepID=UPI003BEA673D
MNTISNKNFLERSVSLYKSITQKNNTLISISETLKTIQSDKDLFEHIEKIRTEKDKDKKDKLKKSLPAITPSATFGEQRKLECIESYTGIICLDFDKIQDLTRKKAKLCEDKFCMAVFISPSGNGLKCFVKVEGDNKAHLENFNTLKDYFYNTYHIEADKSCSDITRLMYLSYDKDLYQNSNSIVWSSINYYFKIYERIDKELNITETYVEGKRNNYVFKLAKKCRDAGLKYDFALKEISSQYAEQGFDINEIQQTVKSAYSKEPIKAKKPTEANNQKSYTLWDKVEEYISENYILRNNIVSTKIEYKKINSDNGFEELDENSIYRELQKKGINISQSKLNALLGSDFVEKYNPFADYFNSLSNWDAEKENDYISQLCEFLPMKEQDRFNRHFKKMLVRCIACALNDNVFNKQVFVLVHDIQNSGKSTFCRWLCPQELSNYITENINTDKDSLIALASNFLINMDELATLNKTEINALKSFISKDKINVRLPFGKRTQIMARRANFIGSTNKDEFLTDETGSVRWLCFELIGRIDFSYKDKININDIWRQAYSLYLAGFHYQLTQDEIDENEKANQTFQVPTFETETIPLYYTPSSKEDGGKFVRPVDIYDKLNSLHPSVRFTLNSIGRALKQLGFKRGTHPHPNRPYTVKGYFVNEL